MRRHKRKTSYYGVLSIGRSFAEHIEKNREKIISARRGYLIITNQLLTSLRDLHIYWTLQIFFWKFRFETVIGKYSENLYTASQSLINQLTGGNI